MPPKRHDIRDMPILTITKLLILYGRILLQGTIILGDPGSGKSSTSRRQIIRGLLRAGFGIFFCTTKPEDTADYIADVKACSRESDLIVFSPDSGHTYDPIAYEWERTTGRGAKDVETIVDYFDTLLSLGKNYSGGGDQRFFELASQQITRVACHLIKLAGEPMSIPNIARAIASFPSYLGEEETDEWQKHAYTAALIRTIEQRADSLSKEDWENLVAATEFVFRHWAKLDERPRSSIAMTFAGMADRFLYNPAKKLFASGNYSFTPAQVTHEHKCIILDFPVNELGKEGARLIQSMIKLTFQRDWLRHTYTPGCCNGGAIVQDEFQLLITKFENHFAQTCRGSGIAAIYITQNLHNLAEELGEAQPGSKTRAFLGNLGLKIAHRCTCPDTCNYLSDIIGKRYTYLDNYSGGGSTDNSHTHFSSGGTRQLAAILDPIAFTALRRPDSQSPLSEAILYCGGETFASANNHQHPEERNYLRVLFSRE